MRMMSTEDPHARKRAVRPYRVSPKCYPSSALVVGRTTKHAKMLGNLVGATGFEPATPCAQGRCATRLRYAPTRRVYHRAHAGHGAKRDQSVASMTRASGS